MSEFFILLYEGGARGCPPFVTGSIPEFVAKPWSEAKDDTAPIYRKREPLELHAKHPLLDFHYASVHALFLASERLREGLDALSVPFGDDA